MGLTKDRKLAQYGVPDTVNPPRISIKMAATKKCYAGGMVASNASGYAQPADATATVRIWGLAQKLADNTSGSNGDISVEVQQGVFYMKNDTGTALTQADIGKYCYVKDDETVSGSDSAGTRPVAGVVFDVDTSLGVAVGLGFSSPYQLNPEVSAGSTSFIARGTGPSSNVSDLTAFTVASNDGITYVAGDQVLLYAQTAAKDNGPYVVGAVSGGTAALTRPDWWPTGATMPAGTVIRLEGEGTLFGATQWKVCAASAAIVVGTDSAAIFPGYVGQQTTLNSGTKALNNVPILSATKTTAIVDLVTSTSNTSTVFYTASAFTASTTGAGTVNLWALLAGGFHATGDGSTLNVGIVNWA